MSGNGWRYREFEKLHNSPLMTRNRELAGIAGRNPQRGATEWSVKNSPRPCGRGFANAFLYFFTVVRLYRLCLS